MRHLGWLHCVPDKESSNRLDQLTAIQSHLIEMPEVDHPYILEWLFELMGGDSLTYLEIESWSRVTGVNIAPRQAIILKRLYSEYKAFTLMKDKNTPPPYDSNPPTKEEVSDKLRGALDSFRR